MSHTDPSSSAPQSDQSPGASAPRPQPPGRRLSSRGLTILLLVVAAAPVVAVLYLWRTLPPVQQHPLAAVLEQVDARAPLSDQSQAGNDDPSGDEAAAGPRGEAEANEASLPSQAGADRVLRFRNASDQVWSNVAVSLNRRFHFHRPGTVAPGETVELYLIQFALRSGGGFDPAVIDVTSVEIMARVPSGARALFAAEAPFEGDSALRGAAGTEASGGTGQPGR